MNATDKPWTMSATRYQYLRGIHDPWMMEISPMQRGRLSKRALREYDKKRAEEWAASGACKQEWAQAVVAAFDAGSFKLGDPDVHEDAADQVRGELRRREEIAKKKAEDEAEDAARITSTEELSVGQQVWHLMYRETVEVVKVNKQSARVRLASGEVMKTWPYMLRRPRAS